MDTGRNKQRQGADPKSPGRIAVDSRGRNVWQWDDNQLDSTSIVLKRLENSALALEPTRKVRRPKIEGDDKAKPRGEDEAAEIRIEQTFNVKVGGGFDPYNRS